MSVKGVSLIGFAFGLLVGVPTASIAANGDIWVLPCTNCNAMVDFGTAALQKAQALVQPGTYVVSSRNYPRTGYVRVTGSPGYECDQ